MIALHRYFISVACNSSSEHFLAVVFLPSCCAIFTPPFLLTVIVRNPTFDTLSIASSNVILCSPLLKVFFVFNIVFGLKNSSAVMKLSTFNTFPFIIAPIGSKASSLIVPDFLLLTFKHSLHVVLKPSLLLDSTTKFFLSTFFFLWQCLQVKNIADRVRQRSNGRNR